MEITVRNDLEEPVEGIPAEEIFAVSQVRWSPNPVLCATDTVWASSPTDEEGKTALLIGRRIGGCGYLKFTVHVGSVKAKVDSVWVTSPDVTGDCAVDGADFATWSGMWSAADPCSDLDLNGTGGESADYWIFSTHFGASHFGVHQGHSTAELSPSHPCLVICPKGDNAGFVIDVTARNARDSAFGSTSIPADSVWALIPSPGPSGMDAGFRFLCRPDERKATADAPTDANEQTIITVNSGGGHSQALDVSTEIGRLEVDSWTGTALSPDIDANGRVDYTDIMIFSIDDQGAYHYRSDMNCDGFVDDHDLLIINDHYGHRCGAASQAVAKGESGADRWPQEVVDTIRRLLSNAVLDRWLGYDLHPELRALLEYVRSLPEPEGSSGQGIETQPATVSLLPQVTALAHSYPNPSRGAAVIRYQVAPPGGHVRIVILDAAGRLVRRLVDEKVAPGFYAASWDCTSDDGRKLANGVYFYQMTAPDLRSTKRMIVVR
jgi:hypothetical protein